MTLPEADSIAKRADDIWRSEFFQKHAASAVTYHLDEMRAFKVSHFEQLCRSSESPLEAAFLAWWYTLYHHNGDITLHLHPSVHAGGRTYKPDIVLFPVESGWFGQLMPESLPKVAIELDGHEFHERTKQQVTYRNRRDRDLQAAGWRVLHVSGSEFNASPEDCVREVWDAATEPFYAAVRALRGK